MLDSVAGRGSSASSKAAAIRSVLRNRQLNRALRGFTAFSVAEQGCWLAILLFAYQRGGVAEAGWVATLLLVPSALAAPLVGFVPDWFPRHLALPIGFVLTAVTLLATGTAMLTGTPAAWVYLGCLVFAIQLTFGGPAVSSVLPAAATSSDELTAGNVVLGLSETVGRLVGPVLAGLLIAMHSPGLALVVIGGVLLVGGIATVGPADERHLPHPDDPDRGSYRREVTAGLAALVADSQVRSLTMMIFTTSVVAGALDVGAAAVAVEVLGRDDSIVSVLVTAYGIGGMVGAAVSFVLLGRRHLAAALIVSVMLMTGAFAAVGWSSSLGANVALLVLVGVGVTLTSVSGRTMMQGLAHDDRLARVFGALEGLEAAGLALGGALLSVVAVRTSIGAGFAAVSAMALLCLLLNLRRLRSIDAARRPVDPSVVRLARSSPIFGPLPPYALERILHGLTRARYEAGEVLMARGDLGYRMCLIAEGTAIVSVVDRGDVERGVGDHLGEIAPLRQVTRTADVRAGTRGAVVYWMDSETFLSAVNGTPRSLSRAEAEMGRRLAE